MDLGSSDGDSGRRPGTAPLRVLVVDDDERVRTMVKWQLEAEGHVVTEAADGVAALEGVRTTGPGMIVLDLSLPTMSGLDVLRTVRRGDVPGSEDVPIIVLSGRSGETDRILGLDLGADDYLVKPFSPGELAARVRSVLRRSGAANPGETLTVGPIEIDLGSRTCLRDGVEVSLTAREFDLLAFLAAHPRRVFSRAQLLRRVWDADPDYLCDATVTEHVHRLRAKIEEDPSSPTLLLTRRGVGYQLDAP
jgi:two-component system, OmpR family, phosphate regulon response regulator PhoB